MRLKSPKFKTPIEARNNMLGAKMKPDYELTELPVDYFFGFNLPVVFRLAFGPPVDFWTSSHYYLLVLIFLAA